MIRVTALFTYPVKSLRGGAVPSAGIDDLGFVGDRRFLVVDETGSFITQRTMPRMSLVDTRLTHGALTLSAEGAGSISVATAPDTTAPIRSVRIWKSEGLQAEDCGPEVAAWLSSFLGQPCGLVRVGARFARPVLKPAAHPGDLLACTDGSPLLVISAASLGALNQRIAAGGGQPVPMNRFRPNIVVDGCESFAEDKWTRITINSVVFRGAGQSDRCSVTTIDPLTAGHGKEPLRTLATFRRNPLATSEVLFGANFINETKRGAVQVGDEVVLAA